MDCPDQKTSNWLVKEQIRFVVIEGFSKRPTMRKFEPWMYLVSIKQNVRNVT